MSSLDALDAENRAACDARRRNIEAEVAQATQQSTEEFRTGMKAFLYSCLVAAVGAVDQHAQTTLSGMKDPAKALREMTNTMAPAPKLDEVAAPPSETDNSQSQSA
jgi:hypothetical protein